MAILSLSLIIFRVCLTASQAMDPFPLPPTRGGGVPVGGGVGVPINPNQPVMSLGDKPNDCGDGSDEEGCLNFILLPPKTGSNCWDDQLRCSNGACLHGSHRCDGRNDCGDSSDEVGCTTTGSNCRDDQFECNDGGCKPGSFRCDGDNDCGDLSDEVGCRTNGSNCADDQLICSNGVCLRGSHRCDGGNDCGDLSDEEGCTTNGSNCRNNQFECNNGRCITDRSRCNGYNDCGDLSDEVGCRTNGSNCADNELICSNGVCLRGSCRCDGRNDCGDSSDEEGCTTNGSNCRDNQFECNNGRCITDGWLRCNGRNDCGDSSDEMGCTTTGSNCADDRLRCSNGACLEWRYRCNGRNDCGDSSDEVGCTTTGSNCRDNQFECNNGRCITDRLRCNGDNDCRDLSDEVGCRTNGSNCRDNQFECKYGRYGRHGRCINGRFRCDGYNDCDDRSDERGCTTNGSNCRDNQFECNNGRCIPGRHRCDGYNDCGDSSDEVGCTTTGSNCRDNQFECNNGRCITGWFRCNGDNDCGDSSDEEVQMCTTTGSNCRDDQFECNNGRCIRGRYRCDGDNNCGDSSDEEGCTTITPTTVKSTATFTTATLTSSSYEGPASTASTGWSSSASSDFSSSASSDYSSSASSDYSSSSASIYSSYGSSGSSSDGSVTIYGSSNSLPESIGSSNLISGYSSSSASYDMTDSASSYGPSMSTSDYGSSMSSASYDMTDTSSSYGSSMSTADYGSSMSSASYDMADTSSSYGSSMSTPDYESSMSSTSTDISSTSSYSMSGSSGISPSAASSATIYTTPTSSGSPDSYSTSSGSASRYSSTSSTSALTTATSTTSTSGSSVGYSTSQLSTSQNSNSHSSTSYTSVQSTYQSVYASSSSYYEYTTTPEPATTAWIDACDIYAPCMNGGNCTVGVNSEEYNCTCAVGYSGATCTEEMFIMPYADADYSVTGDDAISDGVYLPGGLPFGSADVYRLFVSTNGYVVFDDRYYGVSPRTSYFPAPYNVPLIAPYWTDLDARYTNVMFDVYSEYTSKTNQDYIMAALGNYVKNSGSAYTSFTPSMAIVVTWPNVPPYPAYYYDGIEGVTVQLSIVTDGTDSFAMFTYFNMTLTETSFWRQVGIGYTFSEQYGASFYEKNTLSFTTNSYSMDTELGNTDVEGKWIYKINTASSGKYTAAQKCFNWHAQKTALPTAWNTCPTSIWQASIDIRYRYYYTSEYSNPNTPCFISRFWRYDWTNGVWMFETCCYDQTSGALETNSPNAGSAMTNFWDDLVGKDYCCSKSNYCHLYYEMRPISSSAAYRRIFFTWMWGDPHIATLDGQSYTFNGLGEYLMMRTVDQTTMILQARMELAEAGADATVFTAFAAKSNQSDTIQVNLNSTRDGMNIYVNEGTYNYTLNDIVNETEHASVTLSKTVNGSLQLTFETGFGIEFKIGYKNLEASVQAPQGYEGILEGLLGNWDGNSANDYLMKNGTLLSNGSSEREIYDFGKTWQLSSQADSMFAYFGNQSFAGLYNDSGYSPIFADEYTNNLLSLFNNDSALLESANTTCYGLTDYMQCMFDAARMGSVDAASNAVNHINAAESQESTMSNNPPTFTSMNSSLTLYLNATSNMTLNATDPEGGNVTFQLTSNSTEVASIDQDSGMLYITPGGNPFILTVLAADYDGFSSAWQPNVYVCDCLNGGECDFSYVEDDYSESNEANYYGADCICVNGYGGSKCQIGPCDAEPAPCYEGVTCTVVNDQASCGACPSGLDGNGTKCWDIDECVETPNICEDVCTNTMFSYTCSCTMDGYEVSSTNNTLCVDMNECSYGLYDCNSTLGEECVNTPGNYSCDCPSGYERDGDNFCIDIDECTVSSHDCDAVATCTNDDGSWTCDCNSGYNGNGTSCTDTDECSNAGLNDCQVTCNNFVGTYNCSCGNGYELAGDGITCNVAAGSNCSGSNSCNQLCSIQNGNDTCACYSGYELDTSDNVTCIDIDECTDGNLCTQNCVNLIDGYNCTCNSGYSLAGDGYTCENIDECTVGTSGCATNTSTCTDSDGSFSCACNSGYSGDGTTCTDDNECSASPCATGATCYNYPGDYKCQCPSGYYGDPYTECLLSAYSFVGSFSLVATYDPDLADSTTAAYHTLAQTVESTLYSHFLSFYAQTFKNISVTGFTSGSTVTSFTLAFTSVSAASDPTSSSVNTVLGSATSTSGSSCLISGIGSTVCSSTSASDFDECSNNAFNCSSVTDCSNTVGSYECVCKSGYSQTGTDANGNQICADTDECLTTCTLANSECTNTAGSYTCACSSGYISNDPETIACYDACDASPCQNGGACTSDSSASGYYCVCASGYSGTNCETYEAVTTSTIVAIVVGSVLGIIAFILIVVLVILRVTGKLPCLRPAKTVEPMNLLPEQSDMGRFSRGNTIDSYTRETDTPVTQTDVTLKGKPTEKELYIDQLMKDHPIPLVSTSAAATIADGAHPMPQFKIQQNATTLSGHSSGSGQLSNDTGYEDDSPTPMNQVEDRPSTGKQAARGATATGSASATGNVGRPISATRPSSASRQQTRNSPDVEAIPVGPKTESNIGQGSASALPTENEPSLKERASSVNNTSKSDSRPSSGTSIVSVSDRMTKY